MLGGGTAGTMVANKLHRKLDPHRWQVTVIDQDDRHLYQPGFLFVPFGYYRPDQVVRPRRRFLHPDVELVLSRIERVEAEQNSVVLADGSRLEYDYLVIATGTQPRPDQTPGLLGTEWRRSVHEFYTYEGAVALRDALHDFDHGRLVVHITELPIKCPVAPLEFAFLAEAYLRGRGLRDKTEIVYVTPLSGAFTKPIASARLGSMLDERKITVEPDFVVEGVDPDTKRLILTTKGKSSSICSSRCPSTWARSTSLGPDSVTS